MSREKTRPMTRVSRNQTKVVRAAPIRRYRPPYINFTTRLPAALNPSRRVAREACATLPHSRLRCARWMSIIHHRSRALSAKRRRPRSGEIGSARAKAKWTGDLRARYGGSSPSQKEDGAWHQNIFKRKIGKDVRIEKYKCRFVAQGF